MNISTEKTPRIFSALNSTNCPASAAQPIYDRLNHRLDADRHARVAKARPGQAR